MNSIQLTEEHKSKVLEMCKVLFPEYKVKFILDSLLNYDDRIFNYLSIEEITEGEVDFTVIHWFEFCVYHLAPLIEIKVNDLYNTELAWINFLQSNDGINYLYNEFKKLK